MSVHIGEGAVVCIDVELVGDVTIGRGTVVHPKATIIGPVVIGEDNIIEEFATIKNCPKGGQSQLLPLTIGNHNIIEVGATVHGSVGSGNRIGQKALIALSAHIENDCVIGARCEIDFKVSSGQCVSGTGRRKATVGIDGDAHALHLAALRDKLPSYHNLIPPGDHQPPDPMAE